MSGREPVLRAQVVWIFVKHIDNMHINVLIMREKCGDCLFMPSSHRSNHEGCKLYYSMINYRTSTLRTAYLITVDWDIILDIQL